MSTCGVSTVGVLEHTRKVGFASGVVKVLSIRLSISITCGVSSVWGAGPYADGVVDAGPVGVELDDAAGAEILPEVGQAQVRGLDGASRREENLVRDHLDKGGGGVIVIWLVGGLFAFGQSVMMEILPEVGQAQVRGLDRASRREENLVRDHLYGGGGTGGYRTVVCWAR
jgi:hypothetical protein